MRKLSEILPYVLNQLCMRLDVKPGGEWEKVVAEAIAQAHDLGVDRTSDQYRSRMSELNEEVARLEQINRGIIKRLDTQIAEAKGEAELEATIQHWKSEYDTQGNLLFHRERELEAVKAKLDTCEHEMIKFSDEERRLHVMLEEEKRLRQQNIEDYSRRFNLQGAKNVGLEDKLEEREKEIARLKLIIIEKDDTIHNLYKGWVFMVQTRFTGPQGTGWTTIAAFTTWDEGMKWMREMGVRPAGEIARVVSMQLNPELPGYN
jgi:septal ring factor EnvC (AmiA/AmiB activator)